LSRFDVLILQDQRLSKQRVGIRNPASRLHVLTIDLWNGLKEWDDYLKLPRRRGGIARFEISFGPFQ
ncbi:MAG: hypothetical protein ACK5OC_29405, partial [Pirellula sp.]